MGRAYKLQCKSCGTQFMHSAESGYGVVPTCIGCGESSDNQSVIKCPGCHKRLNESREEFLSQVIEETLWD